MTTRRDFRWVWPVLLTVLVVFGCGGGGGGGGGTSPNGNNGDDTQPLSSTSTDRARISFVDNLLVKRDAGEWTLGQGLVATLQMFVGEVDSANVLRHPDIDDFDATGILAMAYEYLEDGPDETAKTEISRLLGLLVFSNDQLEAMAGIAAAPESAQFQRADVVEDCLNFFYGAEVPGVGPCLEYETITELTDTHLGTYRIFHPALPLEDAGWEKKHYDSAVQALKDILPVYDRLFEDRMAALNRHAPSVNLVFSVSVDLSQHSKGKIPFAAAAPKVGQPCGVVVYLLAKYFELSDIKQIIAHEVAIATNMRCSRLRPK